MESLLQRLRDKTSAEHEDLEKKLDFLNSDFSRNLYRATLIQFYRIYRALEPALERALQELAFPIDYGSRRKLPLLERDLAEFNVSVDQKVLLASGLSAFTDERAVGLLYVIEGSTLGGQVLSRHFKEVLGITSETGGAFFRGYGPDTRTHWVEFVAALEKYGLARRSASSRIVEGAVEGFRLFSRELDPGVFVETAQ